VRQPDKPAEKGDEKHGHGEHKEGEAGHGDADQLKLTAEAIEAAGIKTEEIAEAEIVDQLIVTATIRPQPGPDHPRLASGLGAHRHGSGQARRSW
jgi:hypothetical protein